METSPDPKQPRPAWELLIPAGILALALLYGAYRLLVANVTTLMAPLPREDQGLATQTIEENKPRDYTRYGPQGAAQPPTPPAEPPPNIPVAQHVGSRQNSELQQLFAQQAVINATLLEGLKALTFRPTTTATAPTTPASEPAATGTTQGTQAQGGTKKKAAWDYLARGKGQEAKAAGVPDEQKKGPAAKDEAQELIKSAKWARPNRPELTIYRSQTLPCRILQNMTSETGGQVKLITTVPIFGNRGTGEELLPKETLIIAKQTGNVGQGSTRLTVALEQLELPPPYTAIISLKADIGDQDGANGLKGTRDNNTIRIVGAALLSAILNIGVRAGAGSPGQNQYFQSLPQQTAGELGQSIQRDGQSIIDRELRLPPKITIDKDKKEQAFCTVNLLDNVQFSKAPIIVR